jgi:acyl carrier protein
MDIADDIKRIIAKSLSIPVQKLTDDTKLEDLGAESLDIIEIVYEIEEKYDLQISFNANEAASTVTIAKEGGPTREVAFATVGDIVAAVRDFATAKAP